MTVADNILMAIAAALRHEPRINVHHNPIRLDLKDGALVMEGQVANVAAKRLAVERAAAVPGVVGIVDRLRVKPAVPMEDGAIRNHLRDALLGDSVFQECGIRTVVKGVVETDRDLRDTARGDIVARVGDGMVTLDGYVGSLSHKRLAGVLAWWVPGSQDVVNGLEVVPPEEDNDGELADAVQLVLEKDPLVNASQIRAWVKSSVVTLDGVVSTDAEREMAEFDAWYVFAVDNVINRIEVRR
ncbi:MAG: BON domain-containing protein [Acidiferrobacter sp.]